VVETVEAVEESASKAPRISTPAELAFKKMQEKRVCFFPVQRGRIWQNGLPRLAAMAKVGVELYILNLIL